MKKSIRILLGVVFIFVAITIVINGQNRNGDNTITPSQVNNAVQTFSQLVNDKDAAEFGLKNAAEIKSLKAGNQFTNYMIQLDDIKKYKSGDDVNTLIKAMPSAEVALTDANNTFVTSIEFTKKNGAWQATGFGASTDLKVLYNQRAPFADSIINTGKLVRVPALHTSFIALTNSQGLNFIPTEDNENLGFKRGAFIPASDALNKLVQAANIYNGLPD